LKLTNGELFAANVPLGKLLQMKFPVKVSYRLAKLADKIGRQYNIVETVRNGLISTYGTIMAQEVEIVAEPIVLPSTTEIEPALLVALVKFVDVEESAPA
jgi:hypothetical protein